MPRRDPKLREYCTTDRQRQIFDAVQAYPYDKQAAASLNLNIRSLYRALGRISKTASQHGYAPGHWESGVAPGYTMGKVTVHRNHEGDVLQTWERELPVAVKAAQIIADCLENLSYKPAPIIKAPKTTDKTLCSLYTITDFHLGMYAWAAETGEDWDTDIAEKVLVNAVNELAQKAPDADLAILNIQGDFLHWDGLDALTPTSGNLLDADTRFDKMIELSLDLTMQAVEILLKKHRRLRVIVCEGNHDLAGSAWLRKAIKKLYAKNNRITVDDTPFPFYAYLHGKTMIAFHHGHKVKNKSLPALFASEPRYREMWGQATYTYIHTGHYHRTEQDMAEAGGAIVERHPTLAARDAFATRGGYVSRRGARVITYHTEDGEVARSTVLPRISG